MTAAELVGYIGAAAWAPQIGAWLYNAFSKPKLKIVSAGTIEIGFSMLGPIANATLAISSERKDALIEKMSLRVTHEQGERRTLDWRLLSEVRQQIRDPQGNVSSEYKNTPAIAIKVSTLSLTERLVGFRDPRFEETDRVVSGQLGAQFRHSETQVGNAAALEQLLQSMEFSRAQRAFDDFMYWRPGEWEFLFSVQLAGVRKTHSQKFTVVFSDDDITTLRRNSELLVPYVRATLSDSKDDQKLITWNWAYPNIAPSKPE